jgi:hypothetical protein
LPYEPLIWHDEKLPFSAFLDGKLEAHTTKMNAITMLSSIKGRSKLLLTPMSECMNNEKTARYYMDLWSCDLKEVYEIWKLHDKQIKVDDVSSSTIKVMNRNGIDYMDLIELGYAVDKTKIK